MTHVQRLWLLCLAYASATATPTFGNAQTIVGAVVRWLHLLFAHRGRPSCGPPRSLATRTTSGMRVHTVLLLAGLVLATASFTTKGTDLVVGGGPTNYWAHIALAKLDVLEAVLCFNDKGNGDKPTCYHLTVDAFDGSITKGTGLIVDTGATYYNGLAAVSSSALNFCYRHQDHSRCNHLSVSGTTLTAGPQLTVNDQANFHSAGALGTSGLSITCYSRGPGHGPTCNILSHTGTTLSAGDDLIVDSGGTHTFSVCGVDDATAVICDGAGSNSYHLTCNVLSVSGTSLTAGPDLVVNAHSPGQAVSVTALDANAVIVCFRDTGNGDTCTCNHLSISGDTLASGPDLTFSSCQGEWTVSVAAMSSSSAALCYRDYSNGQYLACNYITVDGTSLNKGTKFVVNSGVTRWITVLGLSAFQALVCYQDQPNNDQVTCNTLVVPPSPPISPPPASPPAPPPPLLPPPTSPPPPRGLHLSGHNAQLLLGVSMACKFEFRPGPPPYLESSCPIEAPPPAPSSPPSPPPPSPSMPPPSSPSPLQPPPRDFRIAGSGVLEEVAGEPGTQASAGVSGDGIGTNARFSLGWAIAAYPSGSRVLVGEANDNCNLRHVDLDTNAVTTLAGASDCSASTDGTGTSAGFTGFTGIAIDPVAAAFALMCETGAYLRRIDLSTYVVTTLVGDGTHGTVDGIGTNARLYSPIGIAITPDGGTALIVQSATGDAGVRSVDLSTLAVTTIAGCSGSSGSQDGTGANARFYYPHGIALNPAGTVAYVTDYYNHRIRKIVVANGVVTTLAGSSAGYADGTGTSTQFHYPMGLAITPDGTTLLVGDRFNDKVRAVDTSTAAVTTLGGPGGGNGFPASCSSGHSEVCANGDFFDLYYTDLTVTADGSTVVLSPGNSNFAVRKIT